MRLKKKMIAGIMAAAMACVTVAPAYAGVFDTAKKAETEAKTAYVFTYKETDITVGMEAAPVLKALGKASKTFEQQSCAYQGMDKVYTYAGIEVSTYPVGGKECISNVYFLDKTVKTQEGIGFGSTFDEMVKAYGKGYKDETGGVYSYTLGKTILRFWVTNQKIDGIEYQVVSD